MSAAASPAPELNPARDRTDGDAISAGLSDRALIPDLKKTDNSCPRWRKRLFWKLQTAGWGCASLMAMFFSILEYFPVYETVLLGTFRIGFGFAVTCGLRYPYRRMQPRPGNLWRPAIIVFMISGAAGLADGIGTAILAQAIGMNLADPSLGQFLVTSVFMRWMLFWLWSLLYFGIRYWLDTEQARLRLAQAEAAARSSELQLLRAQVNPHFLFNALNSILAESDNPPSVRALTLALSEYLRFSLQQPGDLQPLGVELDAMENYLRVEKVRFEEKLEYRIDADATARQIFSPVALVQPLVDNAIKYGQRSSIRPLTVTVSAVVHGQFLSIAVINSGDWIIPGTVPSTGTGLANLQRRLQLLYEDEASLTTEKNPGQVRVSVRLPLRKEVETR